MTNPHIGDTLRSLAGSIRNTTPTPDRAETIATVLERLATQADNTPYATTPPPTLAEVRNLLGTDASARQHRLRRRNLPHLIKQHRYILRTINRWAALGYITQNPDREFILTPDAQRDIHREKERRAKDNREQPPRQ